MVGSIDKVRRHRSVPAKKSARSDEDQADREGTKGIESELAQMETELGVMQKELQQVQREREILDSHRRALKAAASAEALAAPQPVPPPPCGPERDSLAWAGVREAQAMEALESKALENCQLRGHVERLKEALADWQKRAMELKSEKNKMVGSRETALEQQQIVQQMTLQYSEAQDELQEMRTLIEDQAGHLEGYRNKYLMARQQVEEQKRLIEQMESEHDRIADQVLAELHRVKTEFEAQLQEVAPLPDILAATQAKMQEERQLRVAAERGRAELNHQLAAALERLEDAEKDTNDLRAHQQSWMEERQSLVSHVDAYGRQCAKLRDDVAWYKQHMEQVEQMHEDAVLDLAKVRAELEASKDQAARQSVRLREQADTMQRSFRKQIGVLEQEVAASRASAATAHKEKEEFQECMKQTFGQAQDRIKNLQSVVNVLQHNMFKGNADKTPTDALPQI